MDTKPKIENVSREGFIPTRWLSMQDVLSEITSKMPPGASLHSRPGAKTPERRALIGNGMLLGNFSDFLAWLRMTFEFQWQDSCVLRTHDGGATTERAPDSIQTFYVYCKMHAPPPTLPNAVP